MSDSTQLIMCIVMIVAYAAGWYIGWLAGQIKANREHLKFLRESSVRADELARELSIIAAAQESQ